MRMKSRTCVLFSAEELQGLVKVSASCVRVERRVRHIAMLPNCLGDLKSTVNGILNSYQNKFDMNFKGFILGYKNVKILTDRATIIYDDSYMHLDIEAEFYIFTPEVGCTLFGIVNKKGVDHIGCLVHKCFHVSIPRSIEETDEEWLGTSVNIGDQVTFTVEMCDFTGSLPYIRGKLLNSSPASGTTLMEDEVDSISESRKKKKKKKHKESGWSLEGAKCDLMVDSLEQEEKEPVVGPQHKKRKRHLENEEGAAAEKKKKMKKLEGSKTVYNETPESEELHFTRLSSEDVEYGTILEDLKETYLNETHRDVDSSHKKKKKKHKSHRDTDENKKTVAKVAEDLEHANECNGDEVMHFPDRAQKVNRIIPKNKNEQEGKLVGEIPDLPVSGLYKTSGKMEESLNTLGSTAFPGSNLQEIDFDVGDLSPKAKKKKLKKHDSQSMGPLDVQSKAEIYTPLQKSPVMDKLESNSHIKGRHHKAKKEKRKKRDSHSKELSDVENKSSVFTTKEKFSEGLEESAKNSLDSNTEFRAEEQEKTVPTFMESLNRARNSVSASLSRQDDSYVSNASSFPTLNIAALPLAGVQEIDTDMKGIGHKAKRKKVKKHDSNDGEPFGTLIGREMSVSLEKSPVSASTLTKVECNADVRVEHHKAKKQKGKKRDLRNKELSDVQNESGKFTAIEESSARPEKSVDEHNLGSHSGKRGEKQVESDFSPKAKKRKVKKRSCNEKLCDIQSKAETSASSHTSVKNDVEYDSDTKNQIIEARKEKRKKREHEEPLHFQSKYGTSTSLDKPLIMNELESNFDNIQHHKTRKEKRKKYDSTTKEAYSAGLEKSAGEHSLDSHTEYKDEEPPKTVQNVTELLNGVRNFMSASLSRQDDSYVSSACSFPTSNIATLPVAGLQETDVNMKDIGPKAKRKKMKHKSGNEPYGDVITGEISPSLQKSPVSASLLTKLECDTDVNVQHHKAKKQKGKKHESHSKELPDVQNESEKSTLILKSVGLQKTTEECSSGSDTGNRGDKQVESVPSIKELINRAKNFFSTSSSRQDDFRVSGISSLISSIAALPQTSVQETDIAVKDFSPKAKKKRVKKHNTNNEEPLDMEINSDVRDQNHNTKKEKGKTCNSHSQESPEIRSEAEIFTSSQKSTVMNYIGSDSDIRDQNHKTKKEKRKTRNSHSEELLGIQNKAEILNSSERPPVMNDIGSNSNIRDQNHKKKNTKRKMHDSHNEELSYIGNESDKSTAKDETVLGREKFSDHSLSSLTGNRDEEQVTSVPSVLELLSKMKNKLKVKPPKKHKKKEKLNKSLSEDTDPLKISSKLNEFQHFQEKRYDNLELYHSVSNEKSTQEDISESYAGVTDEVVANERWSKTKLYENKAVGSLDAATLLKNVLNYSDDHDGTKSSNSGTHVSGALQQIENEGKTTRKEVSDNLTFKLHHNKQLKSKKSKDMTSVSFDPTAMLAEHMLKFDYSEGTGINDIADECESSKEDAVDAEDKDPIDITNSDTSYRGSFSLTGLGMANAQDRKRKKMNKGKGDAMPVQRALPLLSSSHSFSEADISVRQKIGRNNSIESFSEFLKSPSPVTILAKESRSGNKVKKTGTIYKNDVLLAPEQCNTQNEVSRSNVLQGLKSPSVDSRTSAGIPKISPVTAKTVSEVSTDLEMETRTTEIEDKHKTKKRHKEKKSKIKDKGREHKEKRGKMKNAKDHKENKDAKIESSLGIVKNVIEKEKEHKEERAKIKDAEGKQEKSKGNDTEVNLKDLKTLASKLFSNFLQQEN